MKKQYKYENCRMEAKSSRSYCKYHIRMVEPYEKMSSELKEVYERIKKKRYG